jgi:hypothetical protein
VPVNLAKFLAENIKAQIENAEMKIDDILKVRYQQIAL